MVPLSRHWSFSQWNQFSTCGHQHYLERVQQVPTQPSVAAVAGKAFHAWTEVHDSGDRDYSQDIVSWEECLAAAVTEEEEKTGVPPAEWKVSGRKSKAAPDKETLDHWLFFGWELCQKYSAWASTAPWTIAYGLPPDPSGNTTGIEYELLVKFGDQEFKAYLDRLAYDELGNLGVVDIKTWAQKRITAQLGFYSGAARMVGLKLHWGAYYEARKGTATDPVMLEKWDATRVAHMLSQATVLRDSNVYPVKLGDHCAWCGVRDACDYRL